MFWPQLRKPVNPMWLSTEPLMNLGWWWPTSTFDVPKLEPFTRCEHFVWQMLNGSGLNRLRRNARLAQIVCVVAVLLGETSMAVAKIPLPRPRPADISGDQPSTSTNPQPSLCQQQLRGFAEFKVLPPITGPGECLANDVVALDSVILPDKHHVVLSPSATLRDGRGDRALAAR
jgi:hypothetical protein